MHQRDDRWAKQFGDFAENLTMYVLGQMSNMSVALIDHVGADVIVSNRNDTSVRYAVSVKGRNFPTTESKSFNFNQSNIDKLIETANVFGMIPAVSFVFVDDMEGTKKIRMFVAKLRDLLDLSTNDDVEFINKASDGLTFKYTESRSKHWLSKIKDCDKIAYYEFQFNVINCKEVL